MSAFSEYAARSEWNTSINARTPAADLQAWAAADGNVQRIVPVSGDMLAVLKQGTTTQRRRRRTRARNNW